MRLSINACETVEQLATLAERSMIMLSCSRSLYAIARPSVVCRLSVVCLSVTLVRPTQAAQTFGNISTALGTLASLDIH